MSTTLTISDETTTGEKTNTLTLELMSAKLSIRELIRSRVYQEVQDYNRVLGKVIYRGLVQPEGAEKALNGCKPVKKLEFEKQFAAATSAFERNGFLVLVDNRQIDSLDDEITLGVDTTVSFVKLVPLVGG